MTSHTTIDHATTDISPVSLPGPGGPRTDVRLMLRSARPGAGVTTLDGAWWPRSRSLPDELPALITELHRRGVRVARVVYNPVSWTSAPRRVSADGRVVKLGWFRSLDPHLVSLADSHGDTRLELLVVPPEASPDSSAAVMKLVAGSGNRSTATAVLTTAGALPLGGQDVEPLAPRPRLAATGQDPDTTGWESEGGHLHR